MAEPRLIRSLATLYGLMAGLWRDDAATAKYLSTPADHLGGKTPLLFMLEGGQAAIDAEVEWFRNLTEPMPVAADG